MAPSHLSADTIEGVSPQAGRRGLEKPGMAGNCRPPKGQDSWGGGAVRMSTKKAAQEATGSSSLGGGQKVNCLLFTGPAKACPGPLWFQQSFGTAENTEFLGAIERLSFKPQWLSLEA